MRPAKRIVERLGKTGNFYAWLEHVTADFDDGRGSRETYLLGAPDGAFVLPIKDGKLILVKQYRFSAYGWSYEIPGGIIDDGEKPEESALRELEEEAGYTTASLRPLGESQPHAPFTTLHHLFVATDLEPVQRRLERTEKEMTVHEFAPQEALDMIEHGEIKDSKTIVAVLLAKEKGHF